MILIVGLGNPGLEYEGTRHNMGFDVIDILSKRWNIDINKSGFKAKYIKTNIFNKDVVLLKPQTYMNLSGESVIEFINYFHIKIDDMIVVYDDLDLSPGTIRLREKGSSGGQKGMQNIIDLLHTNEIKRVRVGTGKANIPVVNYVLAKPTKEENELLVDAKNKAADALEEFIKNGFEKAKAKYFK